MVMVLMKKGSGGGLLRWWTDDVWASEFGEDDERWQISTKLRVIFVGEESGDGGGAVDEILLRSCCW